MPSLSSSRSARFAAESTMRGLDCRQTTMFHFVAVEDRVPASHPLRLVRSVAVDVGAELVEKIDALFPNGGRATLPPEQVLRALLLWALYGVPSERRLLEELDYNLLFRWFIGLGLEDPVWAHTTFRINKRRLLTSGLVTEFLARVLSRIRGRHLIGNDHFNPNWSLFEEWSGQQRVEPADERSDLAEFQF
jgi:transposase